ncbi:MAG: bifunctional UDP-3-O-[3-hydroxymyristoyl] N-acetylglucosamine deacetylase/3-hydroxyacyl-ACP dehydratase [Lentimicrobiaceae bacterium]|nr:bifunctional UDP-3-O-[3-hydroxymyristoyl] N-acetylglucosamine deacetylase/3-hydroxyacyl-ACP dehydratase [Lentimicrobiaceae bacterium]
MNPKQRTIKNPVSVKGAGLHTGKEVTLTFVPAHENHGYKFKRIDLEGEPIIEALAEYVVDTSRGTTLKFNDVHVMTIEHALAALVGLGIDNALIELDGEETPILDGSARFYIEALEKAGIVEQNIEREYFEITSNISYSNVEKKVEMLAVPCEDYRLSVMIDYASSVLGTQNASLNSIIDFSTQIAPCRTFVFLHELEYLIQNNLIKGGDLNNAIVFVNRIISQKELDRLATFFNKPRVEVLKEGILNNIELRFNNEPARHKLLDVIGDLALVGMPMKGHIYATRPGHSTNVEFAKIIRQHLREDLKTPKVPRFDLNKPPLFDINGIKKLLPHRPPFLFIDKIMEMSDSHVIGVKNVTMNESFFVGHFPDEPVMPGVLQIEAMAQTGGILVLNTVPDPENYITLFMKISDVRFRHKVVPGDTVVFDMHLVTPIRRGICHMKGTAYVGNKIVMEAEMLAQIARKK